MSGSRLESYLDVLERRLPREMRAEWREEARAHLLEIAALHESLGASPEEAIESALQQFGSPEQIGRQMAQSSPGKPPDGRTAVALFNIPVIGALLIGIALGYAYVLTESRDLLCLLQIGGIAAFVAVPVLGGWLIGRRFGPRRPDAGVFAALALLGIFLLPIAGVLLIPAFGSPAHGAVPDMRTGLWWFPLTWLSLDLARRVRRTRMFPSRRPPATF